MTNLFKNIVKKLEIPEYITIGEASKRLNITPFILRLMCEKGEIPCTLTPGSSQNKHHWLIDIAGAREAINNRDLNNLRHK